MAKFYSDLNSSLQNFIKEQKVFFTATAPRNGRINLSPKGIDTFRCIDHKTVAYLDLTGLPESDTRGVNPWLVKGLVQDLKNSPIRDL